MNDDLPNFSSYTLTTSTVTPEWMYRSERTAPAQGMFGPLGLDYGKLAHQQPKADLALAIRTAATPQLLPKKETPMTEPKRRLVRIFIVDPDPRVELTKSILHRTEEMLTDATDQELFYELSVASILKTHNEYRATVVDKKATKKSDAQVFLEPIRIRDLSMCVTTLLEF